MPEEVWEPLKTFKPAAIAIRLKVGEAVVVVVENCKTWTWGRSDNRGGKCLGVGRRRRERGQRAGQKNQGRPEAAEPGGTA